MELQPKENSRHHYITEENTVLSQTESQGIGDSGGRTAEAAKYDKKNRRRLIQGVKSYFFKDVRTSPETGNHTYVTRYPSKTDHTYYLRGGSRDHVLLMISALKYLGEHEFVKDFIKNRAKRPCIDHGYTPGQKVWFKALYSKTWSWVYAIGRTPWLLLQVLLNWLFILLSWTFKRYKTMEEFNQAHPNHTSFKYLNRWRKFWYKLILPMYATLYTIRAVNALESKVARNYLRLILRLYVERHNHVARMMLGDYHWVPDNWVPSRKNRWSIRLDDGYNRDGKFYPEDSVNENMELAAFEYYKSLKPTKNENTKLRRLVRAIQTYLRRWKSKRFLWGNGLSKG